MKNKGDIKCFDFVKLKLSILIKEHYFCFLLFVNLTLLYFVFY